MAGGSTCKGPGVQGPFPERQERSAPGRGLPRRIVRILAACLIGLAPAGRSVGGIDYTCTVSCAAPDCMCPDIHPPGGLLPENTPQIVLLTFDDEIYSSRCSLVQQVLTNHWNPNGSPIQATFYVKTDWTDYAFVQLLHAQGHEIAIHTMTHPDDADLDIKVWRKEIFGARKALARLAGIPARDLVGFRAPNLNYNPASFQALADAGLEYDASVKEGRGGLSSNAASFIWPYTLDNGLAQFATTGIAPTNPFPGLFEVPIWVLLYTNGSEACAMDPTNATYDEVLGLYQTNFLAHYTGNRAPFGVFLHIDWFTNDARNVDAINDFLTWAQSYPDVWVVSTHALVEFMRNPVDTNAAFTFPPFVAAPRSPDVGDTVVTCRYANTHFTTCGDCPPVYPKPDTIFLQAVPATGGVAWIEITRAYTNAYGYTNSYEATLLFSNDTDAAVTDWQMAFALAGGTMDTFWHGTGETNGTQYVVHPSATDKPLQAGKIGYVSFSVVNTGGTNDIEIAHTNAYTLAAVNPTIGPVDSSLPDRVRMEWNDVAADYALQFTTNQNFTGWETVAEIHGRTSWTSALPPDVVSGFYRMKVLP